MIQTLHLPFAANVGYALCSELPLRGQATVYKAGYIVYQFSEIHV